MIRQTMLLASASALFAMFGIAHAQTAANDQSASADAQDAGVEIVVYGSGKVRQEQTVSRKAIEILPPGSSPLKAVARLPGVALQSSDPFGSYELGTRLSVRGFNQSQMGYTLDGVPLGDMFYNNHNGLHISRAIAAENIARVDVSQGAGSLGIASTSNLGGNLEFVSRAPPQELGGEVALTYGMYDTVHLYGRLDSGELSTGTLLSISGVIHDASKWKGFGGQSGNKVNGKIVQKIGDATLTGWLNYSLHKERNYADLSPATLSRIGYDLDFLRPDYATAILLSQISANQTASAARRPLPFPTAGVAFPTPYTNVNDTYYDSGGVRRDWLGAVTLDVPLAEWLDASATYYHHCDKGSGGIYTPAVFSPDGFPLSVRTTEYGIKRDGGLARATAKLGGHTIQIGYWHEDNRASTDRNYYAASLTNRPDVTAFLTNPFRSDFLTDLTTVTNQYFVSDTWKILDALTIAGGFKGARVSNGITTTFGTPFINGKIAAKDWFQPQIGATYRIGQQELFANYAENMRAYISSFRGPFGTTQVGFEAIRNTLKPETSRTVEAGWRFDLGSVRGVVAGYDVKFKNRLLAAFSGANILGNPSILQNVGSVTSRGVEVAATYQVARPLALIASYSYNDSTYDDDTVNGVAFVRTKGVRTVDTPAHLGKGEINYDDGQFFGNLAGAYTSRRNVTYTGDVTVKGYTLFDAAIGYRFPLDSTFAGVEIQINAVNLTDEKYIAALGSGQFFNNASSLNNTLQAGSPRQVFGTLRRRF
ncbi:TonB-dependent receptor [Sphingomonas sp. S-NIH.Pt15_0812]|uniref:TonB-dependent receptor n=1 Tax=Sphingomonas sp. S-NIH.Pt15_0812 TaxID=1920129 RepID=UPI000F7D9AC8|nr:TonB-dependent receptor [Sphingomonas sp. S-NIH.Pt15_0812]RSU45672.1 TonB-dependent receptor [Sphingomonas sp. S-NIH.Pt15_0812]